MMGTRLQVETKVNPQPLPVVKEIRGILSLIKSRSTARYLANAILYIPVYLAFEWTAHAFEIETGVSLWRSSPGWSLGFLTIFGPAYIPALLLATFIGGHWIWKMPLGWPLLWSALLSTTAYSLAASALRRVLGHQKRMKNLSQALQFLGIVLITSFTMVFLGGFPYLPSFCSQDCYPKVIFSLWLSNVVRFLALMPFLLEIGQPALARLSRRLERIHKQTQSNPGNGYKNKPLSWRTLPETLAQALVLLSAFALVFFAQIHTNEQLLYLVFLPVIWLALYYGLEGAVAGVVTANLGIGAVFWLMGADDGALITLQVFMLVLSITGLLLGVVVSERRANEQSLRSREAILAATTYAAERFLLAPDWQQEITEVLARLGRAAGASRAYLFKNHPGPAGELLTSQRFEWAAPAITPQINNPDLQNFNYLEGGFNRWVETLELGQVIYGLVRDFPPGEYQVLAAQDILSIVVVPIIVGGQWWGFIGFDDCQTERQWDQAEIEALEVAANTLGAAIQRQQTEQALRQRERFLTLLNQITRNALEQHDYLSMLQTLADRLGELFDADGCYLTHWDTEKKITCPMAAYGPMRHTYRLDQSKPGEVTMTESVLRAGHPLVVENVHQTPYLDPQIAARYPTVSMLALPLIANGEWLGAALISYHQPRRFTQEEIARGEQVAAQVSLAVAKARLYEAERQRAAQLSQVNALIAALGQVAARVESANDPQGVMETLGQELRHLGIRCLLALLTPDHSHLTIGYLSMEKEQLAQAEQRTGVKFNDIRIPLQAIPLAHETLIDGQPRVQRNPEETALRAFSTFLPRALVRFGLRRLGLDAHSTAIYLPLGLREQIIGLLAVWGANLQEADVSHLSIFASQVAMALEKSRLYADLQRLAITDVLTGCYNRRGLFEMGQREMERARRYGRPLSIIMIDIDHFKLVNDRFGHAAGDLALQALVQRIQSQVREIDLVGRYGGEEFIILLPENNLISAAQVAERLRRAISEHTISTPQGEISLTVSIGVAQADEATENLEALIARADLALYAAKQRGRNCVVTDRDI